MGGDYTRMTFEPRKDFAGVLKQQGRVALDADHNELVEILDRRWRAETIDLVGRCALPVSNPANVDAFRIAPDGAGGYTIGVGRIYVDGLLVECHGPEPFDGYDASLGEPASAGLTLPFDAQPYQPNAALPTIDGNYLAYLLAWRREVTIVEDREHLQEIALGGPDTATRLQTAWQVRFLPAGGATTCDAVPGWDALVAPSSGRLTVAATAPPADTDACTVPPEDGYRGRENRCYRVEVHNPGAVDGAATFKWSRDNGSIASSVEEIIPVPGGDRVVVSRVGRDRVLRFQVGDWVEVLDDDREFEDPGVVPGLTARIVAIEEANRTLVLDRSLPAGLFDATDETRHTRIRRWDQRAGVNADGVLAATSGVVALEDGITVSFGPAGGTLRAGDHWIFAARTADNSVEAVVSAPPHGIAYHFCKLAVVAWPAADPLDDCREPWPPAGGGCCTEVVRPGESIQAAIDRLPPAGGCVCLRPGEHVIDRPLHIPLSHVTLHGETGGATVRSTSAGTLLGIAAAAGTIRDVMVHDIRFETPGTEGDLFLVEIHHARDVEIARCVFAVTGPNEPSITALGIWADDTQRLTLDAVEMGPVLLGVYANDGGAITVRDCQLRAPVYSVALGPGRVTYGLGWCGVWLDDMTRACHVERNTIANYAVGVRLEGDAPGSLVAHNRIHRPNGPLEAVAGAGISDFGAGPALNHTAPRYYAVDARARGTVVRDNRINLATLLHGGIRLAGSDGRAEGNALTCTSPTGAAAGNALAIWVHQDNDDVPVERCAVHANTILGGSDPDFPGFGHGVFDGILVQGQPAPVLCRAHDVRLNRLDRGAPAEGLPVQLGAVSLINVADCSVVDNVIVNRPLGITVANGRTVRVEGNRLREARAGVLGFLSTALRVCGNTLSCLERGVTAIMGIGLSASEIDGNEIDRFNGAIALTNGADNRVAGNRLRQGLIGILAGPEPRVAVSGNHVEIMEAVGIIVAGGEDVTIAHNRVTGCGWNGPAGGLDGAPGAGIAAVFVEGAVTVESCEVTETGRPPADTGTVPAAGIIAAFCDEHVVRGNRVAGPVAGVTPLGRYPALALLLSTGRADVTDNVFSGAGEAEVVGLYPAGDARLSEVIYADNRCRDLTPPAHVSRACVLLSAGRLSLAGNQVTASFRALASFDLQRTPIISAVGNVTNGLWINPPPSTVNVRPFPFNLFNIVNV